jgi:nucleoside-diphosphate-sugar epimerase
MSRRILVLGANGYIGSRVVAGLAASDWAVPVAATRRGRGTGAVEHVRLDARDQTALTQVLATVDGVVNCVGSTPAVMVAAAQSLFAAAAGRPLIVHFSSMIVYGSQTGAISEAAPFDGGGGAYGAAKIAIERMAINYPRATILRPGCIYGPDSPDWSERIASMLLARRLGDLGAAGDGVANLVHTDDVVAAVLAALYKPKAQGQAYNLAMADAPRWNAYFLRFAKALGAVPVQRIRGQRLATEAILAAPPRKIGQILARKTGLRVEVPPPLSPALLRVFRQDIRLVSTKAERELGVRWTDLDQALPLIAARYKEKRA